MGLIVVLPLNIMLSFGGKLLLSSVNLKLVFFFALSRSAKVYLTTRSFGLFYPNKLEIPGINPKYSIIRTITKIGISTLKRIFFIIFSPIDL